MSRYLRISMLILLMILSLNGCTAALVPYTSDPEKKLDYAIQLLQVNRPLLAERLIKGVIEEYRKENNEKGLSFAYRVYAHFLVSPPINEDEVWRMEYGKHGFLDKTTYDKRYATSIEYMEKAEQILQKYHDYDELVTLYMSMGAVYEQINEKSKACEAYKKCLSSYKSRTKQGDSVARSFGSGKPFKINESVIRKWINYVGGCP
ncbi:MAG: hypothetical protein CSYNP_03240 [Syntrophus sp. SKADARSKE-3]|nr:hypothetical protein [Syntrophus sp. SKADARSKE-3]